MALILAGGGNATQSIEVDAFYRKKIENLGYVAFISHAVSPHIWEWEKAENWLTQRDAMRDINVQTVKDLRADYKEIEEAKSVFLMGGNTFDLVQALRDSDQYERLGHLVATKLLYGCSAGAILFGKSIKSALVGDEQDENNAGVTNFNGINLLGGYNVYVHYTTKQRREAKVFCSEEDSPCICISEQGGLYWESGRVRNIGGDNVEVIYPNGNGFEMNPGTEVVLS